jgi:hypothetical protein
MPVSVLLRMIGQVRSSDCINTSQAEHEATVILRGRDHGRGRRAPDQRTYHIADDSRNYGHRTNYSLTER